MAQQDQDDRPKVPGQRPSPPTRPSRGVSPPSYQRSLGRLEFQERPTTSLIQSQAQAVVQADLPLSIRQAQDTQRETKFGLFGQKGIATDLGLRRKSRAPYRMKQKKSHILYTTDEEVVDGLTEFGVFFIFLVVTSLVTVSVRHPHSFHFNDKMAKLFRFREMFLAPSVTTSFSKMLTIQDWWDYLEYNFVITLRGGMTAGTFVCPTPNVSTQLANNDDRRRRGGQGGAGEQSEGRVENANSDGIDLNWSPMDVGRKQACGAEDINISEPGPHRVLLHENLMLGPPRLRQIRVRKGTCHMNKAFVQFFSSCYSEFTNAVADNSRQHKGTPYRTMRELDATPIWTLLNVYACGGYSIDLTYDKNENLKALNELKHVHWLDRGSRLCLVEFNLHNENMGVFQSVKIIAELLPTGGAMPRAHFQTVKKYSFFSDHSMTMIVVHIFWYIMVFYYTFVFITHLGQSTCKVYFKSVLHIIDASVLLICYLAVIYNVWHTFEVKSIISMAQVSQGYLSLDVLCLCNTIYGKMMAVLDCLVWIKIFKFITFNKSLFQFTATVQRSSRDLPGFSLIFGIVCMTYAQVGLLLFGTEHPDFRNHLTSFFTMIRMILGDFQYKLMGQANRILGPIFFVSYIVIVVFILLNMVIAMLIGTYKTVKSDDVARERSILGSYVYKKLSLALYWITHCGQKRQRQPDNAADKDSTAAEGVAEVWGDSTAVTEARLIKEHHPGVADKDLDRLNIRLDQLEKVLKQILINMEDILKRIEVYRLRRTNQNNRESSP
ncbi:polycystic kidney disease 2-like 2 protein [Drosophila subobscura]|uniref:polycystic kidney disease 2-like 2 protein n=1 Tax=Drosophila subobscura TaxID=7241 RepID=UPI00155A9285|nr:polycystic kidney disease 2-like 2 protein [Drosophila subobscura]